jgi:hypothetical protein
MHDMPPWRHHQACFSPSELTRHYRLPPTDARGARCYAAFLSMSIRPCPRCKRDGQCHFPRGISTDNLALQRCANHHLLSRPPSRRHPFKADGPDECETSVENPSVPRRLRVEITAGFHRTDRAGTGRQRPFSGGVSDHIAGRRRGRPRGHFGWSLTPRDCCWRPLRQRRHKAGGKERRPRTTARNLCDDLQLLSELVGRE